MSIYWYKLNESINILMKHRMLLRLKVTLHKIPTNRNGERITIVKKPSEHHFNEVKWKLPVKRKNKNGVPYDRMQWERHSHLCTIPTKDVCSAFNHLTT